MPGYGDPVFSKACYMASLVGWLVRDAALFGKIFVVAVHNLFAQGTESALRNLFLPNEDIIDCSFFLIMRYPGIRSNRRTFGVETLLRVSRCCDPENPGV